MFHKIFGTVGGRILSTLTALAVIASLGLAVNGSASAAVENPALTGKRVLCGYFNGEQRMLDAPCSSHKDPTAPDVRSAWFVGPIPVPGAAGYDDSIKAIVSAMVKDEVAKQIAARTVKASDPVVKDDSDETAPDLSLQGAVGKQQVIVKWTVPSPAVDEKIGSYVLQVRVHDATTWTEKTPVTVPNATVTGLASDTSYDFRVRAEYKSGGNGPWSNVLTAKTAEA